MSRRISVPDLRRLLRDRSGSTSVEFGAVVAVLVALSLAIVDFSLLMFDFARAAEATRRGARIAAIAPPVGNLDNLASAAVICTSSGGTTSCSGGALANAATFDAVVAEMKAIYGDIAARNVQITYNASGIGLAEAGGYKPYVEIQLTNFQRPFYALQAVAGMAPSITLPSFATTLLANSYRPSGV